MSGYAEAQYEWIDENLDDLAVKFYKEQVDDVYAHFDADKNFREFCEKEFQSTFEATEDMAYETWKERNMT